MDSPTATQAPAPLPRDVRYRIALSMLKGVSPAAATQLIDAMGSEKALFAAPLRDIERLTGMNLRTFDQAARESLLQRADREMEFISRHGIRCIYFRDKEYPQRLLQCEDAPVMLYQLGNCNMNPRHSIGIVGTRNATHYGANFINTLVTDLGKKLDDVLIISGLALGCDITAHRRALSEGIPTAAVVAHGLDTVYPSENRRDAARMALTEGCAILSDYPAGTRPFRGNFLARNRIVAGLVDCLIVVESAANHGGALHTARLARDYDREVFALPGRAGDTYSGGCNKLIRRQVAQLCESADDIIEAMGWTARSVEQEQPRLFPDLSPDHQSILELLRKEGDQQINSLTARTGIPVGRLMGMLMELEMEGLVMALPGSRYRPV